MFAVRNISVCRVGYYGEPPSEEPPAKRAKADRAESDEVSCLVEWLEILIAVTLA